uniref:Heat shock protein beta-7-like n=1 Tax=Mastacembelus armatus TaxID=205130 RepID=A0A7N9AZ62_9TELE
TLDLNNDLYSLKLENSLVQTYLSWIIVSDLVGKRQSIFSACMEESQSIFSEDSGPLLQERGSHSYPTGKIQVIGDIFQFRVDVSEFSPEDVIITSSNNLIEVHAEKLEEDGKVTNKIFHQCKLPSDVDPISMTMSLDSSGVLTVRFHRAF